MNRQPAEQFSFFTNQKGYYISFAVILLFSLIIRLVGLDRIPQGVSSDIVLYFSNARAIAETGHDIFGHSFPLFASYKGFLLSPVSMYTIALFYKLFGFSFTMGYMPDVLASTASIGTAGLLATKLTRERSIGIFTMLILSVSPWHYHLSRTGFEGVLAFSFILAGIYCSILALEKPKYYFLSFFLLALSAYTYKAVNIFLIAYPIFFWFTLSRGKSKIVHGVLFAVGVWLIVLSQWFFLFVSLHDTYANGYIDKNMDTATVAAVSDQTMSDAPHRIRLLVSSVPLELGKIYLDNYVHFFSSQYLLTDGDSDLRFSTGHGGQLYLLDVVFIVLGIRWLLNKRYKQTLLFLLAIIFTAPLASLISDEEYAVRTFIAVYAFAILAASGIHQLCDPHVTIKCKKVGIVFLAGLYIMSAGLYLYRYHFLYVHYGRWSWNGINNQVFTQAYSLRHQYHTITFGGSGEFDYLTFMYWNKQPVAAIQKEMSTYGGGNLRYQNIAFVKTCSIGGEKLLPNTLKPGELLYTRETCIPDVPPIKKYYLPKTLIWQWKTYDAQTVKQYYQRENTGAKG